MEFCTSNKDLRRIVSVKPGLVTTVDSEEAGRGHGFRYGRLRRPYDFRVLIEAYVYTQRHDFVHADFGAYYAGLLANLERLSTSASHATSFPTASGYCGRCSVRRFALSSRSPRPGTVISKPDYWTGRWKRAGRQAFSLSGPAPRSPRRPRRAGPPTARCSRRYSSGSSASVGTWSLRTSATGRIRRLPRAGHHQLL